MTRTRRSPPSADPLAAARRRRGLDSQRDVTILSVDLVGSTPLTEQLDRERWRDVVLAFHDICDEAITRYGGTVGSRAGDGLMAHFGLSAAHEDDPHRAVLAALALLEGCAYLRRQVQQEDGVLVEARAGVHHGPVVVTQIGAQRDVVGTTPNVAARIEAEARPMTVLVSEVVHDRIARDFEVESARSVNLRGVADEMTVYQVGRARVGPRRTTRTPMVGRERSRRLLESEWQNARSGSAQPILFHGEAGVGKTRLVDHAGHLAERDGARRMELEHRAYESATPFHALADGVARTFDLDDEPTDRAAYESLCRQLGDLGIQDRADDLARLVGLDLDDLAPLPPAAHHAKSLKSSRVLVEALARHGGLALLVEDLQWADPSTLSFVSGIVERPPPGLLLVMAARPGFDPPWPQDAALSIALEPLDRDDIALWAALHLDEADIGDEQLDRLVELSDGVPLYLTALFDLAGDDGLFSHRGRLPPTLDTLMNAIIDVPEVPVTTLGTLATIGRAFRIDFAADVLGRPVEDLTAELDRLCECGVLDRARGDPETLQFHHALIRTAAYEQQVDSDRVAAHSMVATALERRSGTAPLDAASVAWHLDMAGSPVEAVPHYRKAAAAAGRMGAMMEALRLADRGLELVDELDERDVDPGVELELHRQRTLCLTALEGYASVGAGASARRSLELMRLVPGSPKLLYAMTDLYSFLSVRGDSAAVDDLLGEMHRVARHPVERWSVRQLEALRDYMIGDFRSAREGYRSLIDTANGEVTIGLNTDALTTALIQSAPLAWMAGDADAADDWLDRALARSDEVSRSQADFDEGMVHVWRLFMWLGSGELEAATELAEEALEFVTRKRLVMWRAMLTGYRAICAGRADPKGDASAVLGKLIARYQAAGAVRMTPYFINEHASLLVARGEADRAVRRYDEAIELAERCRELHVNAESYRLRGVARHHAGDSPTAIAADLGTAATMAAEQGAPVFELNALVDAVELLDDALVPADSVARIERLRRGIVTPERYPVVARAELATADPASSG